MLNFVFGGSPVTKGYTTILVVVVGIGLLEFVN